MGAGIGRLRIPKSALPDRADKQFHPSGTNLNKKRRQISLFRKMSGLAVGMYFEDSALENPPSMINANFTSTTEPQIPDTEPVLPPLPNPNPEPAPEPVPGPVPQPIPSPVPETVPGPIPQPVPGPITQPIF